MSRARYNMIQRQRRKRRLVEQRRRLERDILRIDRELEALGIKRR